MARPTLQGGRGGAPEEDLVSRLTSKVGGLALALATAVMLLAPATAQATSTATVVLGSKQFPSGAAVPGGLAGLIPVPGGSSVTLWAPGYVYKAAVPPATAGTVYQFIFWDVNTILVKTAKARIPTPAGGGVVRATAWYLPVCVVGPCGSGPSAVTTWAFSLTANKVLSGTPISSVTPPVAWTSPGTSVSTATAVDIAAAYCFGTCTTASWTTLVSWFVVGGAGTVTISGLDLTVSAGASPYAIAFYRHGTHAPIPNPCPGPECPPPHA
ncbi:MAG: hypothetical protein ACHQNA_10205 [Acidimicrobiales bacterium]